MILEYTKLSGSSLSAGKEILAIAAMTILVGVTARTYALVDQLVVGRIGPEFLSAHIVISYAPFFINCLGLIVGRALIVFLNKETDPEEKRALLSSAVSLGLIAALLAGVLFTVFRGQILYLFNFELSPAASKYLYVIIASAVVYSCATVIRFSYIASKRLGAVLKADLMGNGLNLVGNLLSIYLLKNDQSKFEGCAISTLCAQSSVAIYYLLKSKLLYVRPVYPSLFWNKSQKFLFGDAVRVYLSFALPFAYTAIFRKHFSNEVAASYNIGFYWAYLVGMINIGLFLAGTSWLASIQVSEDKSLLFSRLKALSLISRLLILIPVVSLSVLSQPLFQWAYGLNSPTAIWIFRLTIINLAPPAIVLAQECWLQAQGKTRFLAKVDLFFNYILGISAIWLGMNYFSVPIAYAIGTTLPALTRAGYIMYAARQSI